MVSGNGRTRRFAGIAAVIAARAARSLVFGGEVAIDDQQLRLRFDWLPDPDGRRPSRRCPCSWCSICST
jgi:hypothetical protein